MRQTTTAEVRLEQSKPPSSGPAVGQPVASAAGMEPSRTKLFAAEPKKSDYVPHGLGIRGMSAIINSGTSDFLNASRWVAAFFVVFGHVYNISIAEYHDAEPPSLPLRALHFLSGFGRIAVIIFFVISGFLVGGRAILSFQDKGFSA